MADLFTTADVVRNAGAAILYGAGQVGRDVCRVLTQEGIRVKCMLDRRAQNGESYAGVPILRPDACGLGADEKAHVPLVLTIFNRDVDIPALAAEMHDAGFKQIVSFIDLHATFAAALGDRFWLTRRSFLDEQQRDIDAADALWADDESRAVYRSFIALRRTGAYDGNINRAQTNPQYLPPDVPGWLQQQPVRMVDCGAYDGDTLDALLAAGVRIAASAHFEPDVQNFTALATRARERQPDVRGPVLLWPCAVSDRFAALGFNAGLGEASVIAADGPAHVMAVALDDVLAGWQPTFIKMDIEGSEMDALAGARRLIAANAPDLAICVYHRPADLWRIPLALASWAGLENHRFYLRPHGFSGFDMVLYATSGDPSRPSTEVRS